MKTKITILALFLSACGGGGTSTSVPENIDTGLIFSDVLGEANILNIDKLIYYPTTKVLLPNYIDNLKNAYNSNPKTFTSSYVEIVDEIFWQPVGRVSSPKEQLEDLATFTQLKAVLKHLNPNIKVGVLINPETWVADINVLSKLDKVIQESDWVGTDIYIWNINDVRVKEQYAKDFYFYVQQRSNIPKFLILQGFAVPNLLSNPDAFLEGMAKLKAVSINYNGYALWGTTYDYPNLTPWIKFPEPLKTNFKKLMGL